MEKSMEQQARDLLEQCGVEDAQSFSAGDVAALANMLSELADLRQRSDRQTGGQVSDLTKGELIALSKVIDLWEEILVTLSTIEAHPRDYVLYVESEIQPGYLGWIGYSDSGTLTFQPATKEAADE